MDIIKFKEKAPIRVQVIKGEPWFVAKDVCDLLSISNSRDAVRKLKDSEAGVVTTDIRSENGVVQKREMTIVNESGLYSLIFQSRKPAAQEFRYWVTSEVLPSIRKYGKYALPGSNEQRRLEQKLSAKERKEWLGSIEKKLAFTDLEQIGKKVGIDSYEVSHVLRDRKKDTTVEYECVVRAMRNAKLRRLLDDSDFRLRIMEELNNNNYER